jgi:hypothetical protein
MSSKLKSTQYRNTVLLDRRAGRNQALHRADALGDGEVSTEVDMTIKVGDSGMLRVPTMPHSMVHKFARSRPSSALTQRGCVRSVPRRFAGEPEGGPVHGHHHPCPDVAGILHGLRVHVHGQHQPAWRLHADGEHRDVIRGSGTRGG